MKVALVQHDIEWEERDATLAHLESTVSVAARSGAELVVLTEMFAVGFSMATDKVAEAPDGPTSQWLARQAELLGVHICGSIPTAADGIATNRFTLAGPDGILQTYDKRKPFSYGGESEHYGSGGASVTWDVGGVRLTPFVCYDLRFADLWWERGPGTDLFVCVASWPAPRKHHWRSLLIARAIENQAFVVGCNRVGEGGGLEYAGGSVVVDPMGEVVADAGDGEEIVMAEIDPANVGEIRAALPFLLDR